MHQGRFLTSNRATRWRIVNKAKRIDITVEIIERMIFFISRFTNHTVENDNLNEHILNTKVMILTVYVCALLKSLPFFITKYSKGTLMVARTKIEVLTRNRKSKNMLHNLYYSGNKFVSLPKLLMHEK